MMAINSIKFLVFVILCNFAQADTLEIFLNRDDQSRLTNLNVARIDNASIVYYFMDEKARLEKVINDAITTEFNKAFEDLKASSKMADLKKLSDNELTKRVVALYQKKHGDKHKRIIQSLMTDDYMAQINRASQDITYAREHNIADKDLPVMIYKKRVITQNYDIKRMIQK